ncbi:ROK family protein [Nocardia speluncae]|uniref:ROK family protein n=1 Tax=Nocardia speluncae TaxID=419477 RepID=A0A846XLA6_9NOCA|nr:ROK family protein [Nocardia speluncae]NKY35353.1 ROK family protein [Nocardia speluncae]
MRALVESTVAPMPCAIGVDVGRTKIAAGVVTGDGRVLAERVVAAPSHLDQLAVVSQVAAVVEELAGTHPEARRLGVGTPEVVEWPSGRVLDAGGSGQSFALRDLLEEAVSLPTVVDSDANMAAWAEFRAGSAVGTRNAVIVTVGTGVGGGIVTDGQLYRGSTGFAGELGHIVVQPEGVRCQCGNRGCLEALSSGTALTRNGRRAAQADPAGMIARLAGSAEQVTGETVFEAALQGDPQAVALFGELGHWLGIGMAAVVLFFDPDVVVVGGGLARTGDLLLGPAGTSMNAHCPVRGGRMPRLEAAAHPRSSGVLGAGMLALDSFAQAR